MTDEKTKIEGCFTLTPFGTSVFKGMRKQSVRFFQYECPLVWENLEQTDDPKRRDCPVCTETVVMLETPGEYLDFLFSRDILRNKQSSRCIAIRSDSELGKQLSANEGKTENDESFRFGRVD